MSRLLILRLLPRLGVAALLCVSLAAVAKVVEAKLDPKLFGHLDQHKTDCKDVGCGPTAVANSFMFLQTKYGDIYKGDQRLIPAPAGEAELIKVANELGQNMGCGQCGTGIEMFVLGKLKYFADHAPGTTDVHGQINFAWRKDKAGDKPKPAGIDDRTKPQLGWLADQIRAGQDVELFVGSGDDAIQHYVTLTGLSFDDASHKGTMWIIDPWDGTDRQITIDGLNEGFIDTGYTIGGKAADFVYHAVAESPRVPIPEPGTWVLLVAGGLLVALRARRHH